MFIVVFINILLYKKMGIMISEHMAWDPATIVR